MFCLRYDKKTSIKYDLSYLQLQLGGNIYHLFCERKPKIKINGSIKSLFENDKYVVKHI